MVNKQRRLVKRTTAGMKRGARIDALAMVAQSSDATRARRAKSDLLIALTPLMNGTCAKWATRNGVEFDDVFQEASLGFLRAIDLWRPAKGAGFLTYVGHWLEAFAGRAEMVYVDGAKKRPAHRDAARWRSFDGDAARWEQSRGIGSDATLHDVIGEEPEQLDFLTSLERHTALKAAIAELPRPEREVIRERLDEKSLREIAAPLDISRERVRQIELQAKLRLRKRLMKVLDAPEPPTERARHKTLGPHFTRTRIDRSARIFRGAV